VSSLVEFSHPRLVAVYDTVNPYEAGTQPDFMARLAAEVGAKTIVDLGCGTGQVTVDLARQGYRMVGVEPSAAMLAVARAKDGADAVQWIEGGAEMVGTFDADLAIMTGHVAQFFLTDDAWHEALGALHGALRPGGRLAFESRNPDVREWTTWATGRTVEVVDPIAGPIESWCVVDREEAGVVSYANHYRFAATGDELVAPGRLRFRTQAELAATLAAAGFTIEQVYGDWDLGPPIPPAPELIVVARR